MDPTFEQKYHALEESHWWFRARRHCILNLLHRQKLPPNAAILDIGCSGGALLSQLHQHGFTNTTGIDLSPAAITRCQTRGLTNVHAMDAQSPALPPNHFDCLIASDILEHLPQPDLALYQWQQLLRPGGILLVFVPAFNFLWSDHDLANHHFRRYTHSSLRNQIHNANFKILRTGYWNCTLFPAIALARLAQRFRPRHQTGAHDALHPTNPILNKILLTLLQTENHLLPSRLPFPGISTWTLAQRPE